MEDYREKVRNYSEKVKGCKVSRVEIEEDQKLKNSMKFNFHLEDHTLGNLLRMILLKNKNVKYAGYRSVHPLETCVEVKL